MDKPNGQPDSDKAGRILTLFEAIAVMAALQAIKSAAEYTIGPLLPDTLFAKKMLAMAIMLALAAAVVLYARLRGEALPVFPGRFSRPYIICTVSAAALLVATPSNYSDDIREIMALFYGSIVTPVYEELLFRGYIWGRLARPREGKHAAYILSSLLFGLWHIGYMLPQMLQGNWPAALTKLAVGLAYGFILGIVRQKTGNCYSTMLLHGVMNVFAF